MRINEITLTIPAGAYYIGDPCYVIDDDRWMEFVDKMYPDKDDDMIPFFKFDKADVVVFGTRYGDGVYPGTDGFSYGVDAGLIGAVPQDVAPNPRHPNLVRLVEFDADVKCTMHDDGTLEFGGIRIYTGTLGDEEDDPFFDYLNN